MNTRKLLNGLIVLSLLLPVLLTGSPTPTQAAPEAARVPIGLNRPLLIGTAGVELSPGSNRTAHPGSIVTYTHTLTNTGIDTDTFTLAVSSSHGWPVAVLGATGALSLPLELEAGLTATLLVSLTVPTAAISGTLDTAVLTATSQTVPDSWAVALDTTTVKNVIRYVYLPLVIKRWPPVPDVPVLNPIINPDGDGTYTVSWNAADRASTYTLQEDDNAAFSSPTAEYTGPGTSWPASGKTAAVYYYRVKATNSWGDSGWSNIQSVTVVPPPAAPVLNPISNPGGVGNYTVSWNAALLADTYTLQEDDIADFSSPTTLYTGPGTSWPASGKPVGTYYYRVKATNVSGDSGWSNIQSVTVLPQGQGIHGRVTYQGVPILGAPINLRFYNGSSYSTIRTTTTQADGLYQFTDAPTLTSGQRYYVRYSNSANSNFVAYCGGIGLSSYTAGTSVAGGDFDIANIPQMSPPNGATIALPYTFQWTKRLGVPSDSYILEIWNDTDWWETSPSVGYVSQYTLNSLPSGLSHGTQYRWDVAVSDTDSYCYSFDQNRIVTFSSGVTSPQDSVEGLRSLHNGKGHIVDVPMIRPLQK